MAGVGRWGQLSLVGGAGAGGRARAREEAPASGAQRVFEHWRYMLHRPPEHTGFGPGRQRTIGTWLTVYGEATLLLAIDGAAADAWIAERGGQFASIEWIFADEARIERYAEAGVRLRQRAAREAVAASAPASEPAEPTVSPEDAQRAREQLRAVADRLRKAQR